jgi:hypothetical protein
LAAVEAAEQAQKLSVVDERSSPASERRLPEKERIEGWRLESTQAAAAAARPDSGQKRSIGRKKKASKT